MYRKKSSNVQRLLPRLRGIMGIIFDIQKFCLHDGPGIRTTVFLKGCNIRCLWCHNPESFKQTPELSYNGENCVVCMRCASVCPKHAHTFDNTGHHIDRSLCTACGACVKECLFDALKIWGRESSAEAVLSEIVKDRPYFTQSGGGITISGGEPTMQYDFLIELLIAAKKQNLHVCLETNGILAPVLFQKLTDYVDLFLLDYKATGMELHKKLTGTDNHLMLENLAYLEKIQHPLILRCPIIPGYNDTEEHFSAINHLRETYSCIQSCEIMPYHSLGRGKWEQLGNEYTLSSLPDASVQQKESWNRAIRC